MSEEGDSPLTEPVAAIVPTPPDDAAHLEGVYDVSLTVRSARSIGAAFGIENPLPGKRGTDRWSFAVHVRRRRRRLPLDMDGAGGRHHAAGVAVEGQRSRGCRPGAVATGAPRRPSSCPSASVDVAVVDGAWVVTGFRGSATVSFRCPGFPAASATVEVTGSR